MLNVTKATKKEIKLFNEKEWHGVDVEHYGRPVVWKERKFIFKATENGEIVGTILGKFESGVLYISAVIVTKTKGGRGVGKVLIEKAEDFGRKFKAHKTHLVTGNGWAAEKFYEALGYKRVADLPKHYFERDFVIYEKLLK